ncbi:MAG: phosphate signaling complex protein PhoU [Acidobacteriota bacterium]
MGRGRDEIQQLLESIAAMADDAGNLLRTASEAFLRCDMEALPKIRSAERALNRQENANDARCLRILALYQPEADDLRGVLMALKINNDLERIGDHALNVAERAEQVGTFPSASSTDMFRRMSDVCLAMLSDAITAFVARDTALAKTVIRRDDEVDELLQRAISDVLSERWSERAQRQTAIALVFAAKEFERIADLCTNVAEDVVFMAEGTSLKHLGKV